MTRLDLDRDTLFRAGGIGAVVAFAVIALGAATSSGGRSSGWVMIVTLAVFTATGYGAARMAPSRALVHGSIAALGAALAVGLGGMAIRLSRRSDTSLIGELVQLPFVCLLAMSCGMGGAFLAQNRSARATPGT